MLLLLLRELSLRLLLALLDRLLLQEAEDVVEDEVAIRLLSKEEGLHELPPWLALVGHFTDDLDNNAAIRRGLGIYGVDEDFAVLEADRGDLGMDFLQKHRSDDCAAQHNSAKRGLCGRASP